MSKYLAGRLLQTVPTVFLVTVAVFLMLHLTPGDPAEVFLGDKRSSPELLEKVREDMGLNRPLHIQYLSYMGNALRGDLGRSLQTNVPVMEQILNRLPWTIELAAAALMIAAIIGISVGIVAALNHNTIIDTLSMALALVSAGSLARMVRSSMLEALQPRLRADRPFQGYQRALCGHPTCLAQCADPGRDHPGFDAGQFAQRRGHYRDDFRATGHRAKVRRGGPAKGFHDGTRHHTVHRPDVRAGQHRGRYGLRLH